MKHRPLKSRYYRFNRLGGPDVLELAEETIGDPGPDEIRLRQKAVGLNFTDVNLRRGDHPELPVFPHRIGQEASGVVDAVGADVTEFSPGDRVAYAVRPPAAYCEARLIQASKVVPIPDWVSFEAAAAGLLKGITAEFLTCRVHDVRPGDNVVFYAAAGGVGQIACRWLMARGANLIPVVGSRHKVAAVRAVSGCERVLVMGEDDIPACVREITEGAMADVVYDSLGAVSFETSLACLRRRGLFVAFGAASGQIPPTEPVRLAVQGSIFMTWARIGDYTATRDELRNSAERVFAAYRDRTILLDPTHRFSFEDAAQAHASLEGSQLTGASILILGS